MIAEPVFIPHVLLVWCCYHIIKLYKLKDEDFIKKRIFVFAFNFTLVVCMLASTLSAIALLYLDQHFRVLAYMVQVLVCYSILFFLNVKNWIVYYNYHWTYYTLQFQWQKIIGDPNSIETNWFIKNKYRYGNLRWVYKWFGLLHLTCAIIVSGSVIFMTFCSKEIVIILNILCFIATLILVIIYAVIVKKTPKWDDVFYLHKQSKIIAKILLAGYLIFFCSVVIISVVLGHNKSQLKFASALNQNILFLMWASICYTSTVVITNKNRKQQQIQKQISYGQNRKISDTKTDKDNSHSHINYNMSLDEVLTDKNFVHSFMKHLSKEYSMENLLSFIEINQFQQFILDQTDLKTNETMQQMVIKFPPNIPFSKILSEKKSDNILNDIKSKANSIYLKYIAVGAEYEINISWIQRQIFSTMLQDLDDLLQRNDLTPQDLFVIFHECKAELVMLMRSSLTRFKLNADFRKMNSAKRKSASSINIVTL